MKIAIIGATGSVGAPILAEALSRGHTVRAFMRDKKKLPAAENLDGVEIDINDSKALADAIAGYDVVHAYAPPRSLSVGDRIAQRARGTESIIRAVKQDRTPRLVAVGGAGMTEVTPGVPLMESHFFPPQYEGGAKSTAVVKDLLKRENEFDWVVIPPELP